MEQQLYELPEGWEWNNLGDVLDVRDGTHDSPKYQQTGYPLVTSKNLTATGLDMGNVKYISHEDFRHISKRSGVDKGDILFAMIGTIGNPIIIEKEPDFAIKNVALFKPRDISQCMEYFRYFLLSPDAIERMMSSSKGAAQKFVGLGVLRGFNIPHPPLNEQKRIVAKLDALFTRIDTAVNHLQQTLKLSKALFASELDSSLVPTGDIENPLKTWSCQTLATVSNLVSDGTHHSPKEQFDQKQDGLFKYITSKNIKFGGMKLENITYIRKDVHDEIYARCNPEYLDQLITKDGAMTGTCCLNLLDEEFSLLSSVALVKLKRELMIPYFLNYFLQSPTGQELMIGDISGAAITRTNLRKLKAIKIPVPPIEEQQNIVTHLDALAERTLALGAATQEKLNDLTTLKASLLDAAFKGQL